VVSKISRVQARLQNYSWVWTLPKLELILKCSEHDVDIYWNYGRFKDECSLSAPLDCCLSNADLYIQYWCFCFNENYKHSGCLLVCMGNIRSQHMEIKYNSRKCQIISTPAFPSCLRDKNKFVERNSFC
jgi:hypothetical protein